MAARISKPNACVPALTGTPGTMDKGSETWAAYPLFLSLIRTLPGQLPRVQPGASHGWGGGTGCSRAS